MQPWPRKDDQAMRTEGEKIGRKHIGASRQQKQKKKLTSVATRWASARRLRSWEGLWY